MFTCKIYPSQKEIFGNSKRDGKTFLMIESVEHLLLWNVFEVAGVELNGIHWHFATQRQSEGRIMNSPTLILIQ